MRFRIIRLNPQCGGVILRGLLRPPPLRLQSAEVIPRLDKSRFQSQRGLIMSFRLLDLTLLGKQVGEVIMDCAGGPKLQGSLEQSARLLLAALLRSAESKVSQPVRVVGLQSHRLREMAFCGSQVSRVQQGDPEIVMRHRVIASDGQGMFEEAGGVSPVAHLSHVAPRRPP